ncbi:MAG: T9SS type A sorting domain-containing protein, partial [Bacteroidales bacterium]|nr:T9SS type A sorting domain-containing protein [Bacteroidales bacterium]
FNQDANPEGWSSVWPGHANIHVMDSIMTVNVTDSYPEIISPGNQKINAATYNKLKIKVKNNTTSSEWYYGFFDQEGVKRYVFLPGINIMDDEYMEYTLNLSGTGAWKGFIDQIELLPARKTGAGSVYIDYIRLLLTDSELSDDVNLNSLLVNGIPVENFAPDSQYFKVVLPPGTLNLPVLEADAMHPGATVQISQPQAVNGYGTVTVISQSGLFQKMYQVEFKVEGFGTTHAYFDFEDNMLPGFWESEVPGYNASVSEGALLLQASKNSLNESYTLEEINFRGFDLYPWLYFSYKSEDSLTVAVTLAEEDGSLSEKELFLLPPATEWTDFSFNLAALAQDNWGKNLDKIQLVVGPESPGYEGILKIDEIIIGQSPKGVTFSLPVEQDPELLVDLGPDTTLHHGGTYWIDAGIQEVSYLWNTGDTTGIIGVEVNGPFFVQVRNAKNCTAADTVNVIFEPTGIENQGENRFHVYPNPAKDVIYLYNVPQVMNQRITISIIEHTGKVASIQSFNGNEPVIEIIVKQLVPGLYILKLEAGDRMI